MFFKPQTTNQEVLFHGVLVCVLNAAISVGTTYGKPEMVSDLFWLCLLFGAPLGWWLSSFTGDRIIQYSHLRADIVLRWLYAGAVLSVTLATAEVAMHGYPVAGLTVGLGYMAYFFKSYLPDRISE